MSTIQTRKHTVDYTGIQQIQYKQHALYPERTIHGYTVDEKSSIIYRCKEGGRRYRMSNNRILFEN